MCVRVHVCLPECVCVQACVSCRFSAGTDVQRRQMGNYQAGDRQTFATVKSQMHQALSVDFATAELAGCDMDEIVHSSQVLGFFFFFRYDQRNVWQRAKKKKVNAVQTLLAETIK